MNFEEYRSFDGTALCQLLSRGDVSPAQVMRCAIDAAVRVDEACNVISYSRYEAALEQAGRHKPGNRPFDGLPFLIKDSGVASTDLPASIGSRLFEGTVSPLDATVVSRFRAAGLITFARTTVPEMCMAPTTEARHNGGPTRNPFDRTRSSGGSSGGAAVAVAAGVVPIAHGSDGGGSIRIPASSCGVFGLKPSRGRVPMGPLRGEGWGGLAADGVLTRTVRDTARALDAIAGMEPGAPYAAPAGAAFEAALSRDFTKPLRIAVWSDPWGLPVAPACLEAVEKTGAVCRALGHDVVSIDAPEFDYAGFLDAVIAIMSANIASAVQKRLAHEGREPSGDDLEPAILDGYRRGVAMTAAEYVDAINLLHATGRMMARMIDGYDLVLTPTLTTLPPKLGTLSMDMPDFRAFRHRAGELTAFLAVVNASGQPAASVPMWREGDLPVGVQVIGRFGEEDTILRLAARLEQTDLWKQAAKWPAL